jgi:uncharacterized membrane protein YhaH (DUF805 family)
MLTDFFFMSNPWLLPAVMLVVMGLSVEVPYRLGAKGAASAVKDDAFNIMQAGLFTLAAFVLGLSFAQASGRYDARRALVVKEANAIGTTWLRAGQLQPNDAATFRRILTEYTEARLNAYGTPGDPALYKRTIEGSDRDQAELWSIASTALRAHDSNLGLSLLMQTLNDTIDASAEQLQALTSRTPTAMISLTILLVILSTLSIGVRFARDKSRPALMSAIFVAASVVVTSMVVDYDRPQTGFVTVNLNPLKNQLQSMQQPPP